MRPMPEITVIKKYTKPIQKIKITVKPDTTLAQLLYKLGLRYDSLIIAYNGEVVSDPQSLRIEEGSTVELLELADGG
mgnify:CR=1 FL=1